jgi:deoxycytidylate deaminase
MSSFDKIERAAREAARRSTHETFNLGAVLVARGSIVSTSCNIRGFGGLDMKYDTHAEARLLDNPPAIARSNAEVYVCRLAPSGRLAMSRPCESCQRILKSRNVSRVFYTDSEGNWQRLELD